MNRFDKLLIIFFAEILINFGIFVLLVFASTVPFYFSDNFVQNIIFAIMIFFGLELLFVVACKFFIAGFLYYIVDFPIKNSLIVKELHFKENNNEGLEKVNCHYIYCLKSFNLKTIALYKIPDLSRAKSIEARHIGNNYIRGRFKKANNYCSLLPHWSYEINIFSYDGDYDEEKAQRLVSKLNSDKSILNKKFNFLFFPKEKRLVVNKFIVDDRFLIPGYFLAYRKAIKLTCKAFNLDYSKFTYEL